LRNCVKVVTQMWIRTQDRAGLIDAKDFRFTCSIGYNMIQSSNFGTIGEYATKERALQVLDEIQETLTTQLRDAINRYEITCVYEMPKE